MFAHQSYRTPEGFDLWHQLAMPDARSFTEVLEYVAEWDHDHKPAVSPQIMPTMPDSRERGTEVGPFCVIETPDGPRRSVAVRATPATLQALAPRIVSDDDHMSFSVIVHKENNRALIVANFGQISGGVWLAYVDPATIPPYPFAARDERLKELTDAIRGIGKIPFRHKAPAPGVVRISPSRDERRTFADVFPDGSSVETWPDGSQTRTAPLGEPPTAAVLPHRDHRD